ncbi:MAG: hypothetical protein K8R41_11895, partial [Bacteroidales bacterium]|nr:hypothetical protein [Bacteroidales bacterium]
MSIIIGIGGVSRAGKTTLAYKIRDLYPKQKIRFVHGDDVVKAVEDIPMIRDRVDWECIESFDYEKIIKRIKDDFDSDIIICEGILIFHNKELFKLFDKKIIAEISKDCFYERKSHDNRWGYEPRWYIDYIWEKYIQHYSNFIDNKGFLKINGETSFDMEELRRFLDLRF